MTTHKVYDWESLRKEFRTSDLSVEAFAKFNGFSRSTGHNHLNDIAAQKRQEQQKTEQVHDGKNEEMDFIPLELSKPETENDKLPDVTFIKTPACETATGAAGKKTDVPIELEIGNVSITLHTGFEKADLRNILEVVRGSC